MKKADVRIGSLYIAKVSGVRVAVRIVRESPYGGWDAQNQSTGREVRIKTAARLSATARPTADDLARDAKRQAAKVAEQARAFESGDCGGAHAIKVAQAARPLSELANAAGCGVQAPAPYSPERERAILAYYRRAGRRAGGR